ncbi:MAG TPA: 23S rRNA (adenine(2503)-C(2))-methyltransferase RlmN [Acidimicrobiales bacterium]|nr:23S rRNA (adenine(2503)-C(2))-methyltransferase RlmN [Acidimicrobiales bacterium]
MHSAFELTREELEEALGDEPRYRREQVWRGLWERGALPAEMTDLPARLRQRLSEVISPALTAVTRSVSLDGGTTKWLWRLGDGTRVETVLMLYSDRATVCVSSQAGCAMGCSFCATGQGGFRRHLTTGEIVEQVVTARRAALPRRLSNVVFMGMGEPLANYDRTWVAVRRIHDDIGISARHITMSTVGVVPGIRRLAGEVLPVNLAVSLHAARDELRDQVVPLNRRYPLSVLMGACAEYVAAKNRRLSFEWALIEGVNVSARDAAELAELALPLRAHVNLIPLNPTAGYLGKGATPARVAEFRDELLAHGVNTTVRANRGTDIDAACGQLAARDADSEGAPPEGTTWAEGRGRRGQAAQTPVALGLKPVPD